MNSDRIKEIQKETNYPNNVSVMQALLKVWNECEQEKNIENKPPNDLIVESVIGQYRERSEVGIKKYNNTMDRKDLSNLDWLTHLQQEMMDATLYIEKLKNELK